VGVEPDVAVHVTARPIDGVIAQPAADQTLDAAIEVARRATARASVRPAARATAAR
jgi:hypothetical protein